MRSLSIIFFFVFVHASAQNAKFPVVKINVPCSNEFINNYNGKWLIHNPNFSPNSINDYHEEVAKRLNAIQDIIHQTYPEPKGADVEWGGSFYKSLFADQVKYVEVRNNELQETKVKSNPVYYSIYGMVLYLWSCTENSKEISNIYPEVSGSTGLMIKSNFLEILNGNYEDGDEWTIDGRPIKKKMFTVGKWKGYDVMSIVGGDYANL